MKWRQNDSSNEAVLFPMASPQALAAADSRPMRPPGLDQPFVNGAVEGPAENSPGLGDAHPADRWGSVSPLASAGYYAVRVCTRSGRPDAIPCSSGQPE